MDFARKLCVHKKSQLVFSQRMKQENPAWYNKPESAKLLVIFWHRIEALAFQVGASDCGSSEAELLEKALQSQKLIGLHNYLRDLAETATESDKQDWNDKGD